MLWSSWNGFGQLEYDSPTSITERTVQPSIGPFDKSYDGGHSPVSPCSRIYSDLGRPWPNSNSFTGSNRPAFIPPSDEESLHLLDEQRNPALADSILQHGRLAGGRIIIRSREDYLARKKQLKLDTTKREQTDLELLKNKELTKKDRAKIRNSTCAWRSRRKRTEYVLDLEELVRQLGERNWEFMNGRRQTYPTHPEQWPAPYPPSGASPNGNPDFTPMTT